jgi:hypothetical protein
MESASNKIALNSGDRKDKSFSPMLSSLMPSMRFAFLTISYCCYTIGCKSVSMCSTVSLSFISDSSSNLIFLAEASVLTMSLTTVITDKLSD